MVKLARRSKCAINESIPEDAACSGYYMSLLHFAEEKKQKRAGELRPWLVEGSEGLMGWKDWTGLEGWLEGSEGFEGLEGLDGLKLALGRSCPQRIKRKKETDV